MKRFPVIAVVFLLLCSAVSAVDYTVDPGFVPPSFGLTVGSPRCGPEVGAVHVQADGKIVVGGSFEHVNGQSSRYLARLNADGTHDTSFNSVLTWASTGGQWSCVRKIRPLPDGDLLVIGEFRIVGINGDTFFARLNPDGSLDNSLTQFWPTGGDMVQLPDGKYIVCGGRMIDNVPYDLAHRINADGSPDPTFRILNANGFCRAMARTSDGKYVIAAHFADSTPAIVRINPDGTRDMSFQSPNANGLASDPNLAQFPDGNLLVAYSNGSGRWVQKLDPNGNLIANIPNCFGRGLLPEADGSAFVNGCRKWPGGINYEFGDILADGRMSPDMDPLIFNDPVWSVYGFADAGSGKYYAFGTFGAVEGIQRNQIVRLMPRAPIPFKARFDFDGDGKSDHTVWRKNGDRIWYINQSTAGLKYFQFGLPTDIPVAADYNQDGRSDVAVWRNGLWYIWLDSGLAFRFLGRAGDEPFFSYVQGSNAPILLMRRTVGNTVEWRRELGGGIFYDGQLMGTISGELPTDYPISGDFDGDTYEEIGYFQDGLWVTRDMYTPLLGGTFDWGQAGDIPVPADYDGDAKTDYAIFRPSTGDWWINNSGSEPTVVRWGISTDIPVPADYDGDGRADISIFRDGQWWHILSSTGTPAVVNWGIAGDVPIPAQHG